MHMYVQVYYWYRNNNGKNVRTLTHHLLWIFIGLSWIVFSKILPHDAPLHVTAFGDKSEWVVLGSVEGGFHCDSTNPNLGSR